MPNMPFCTHTHTHTRVCGVCVCVCLEENLCAVGEEGPGPAPAASLPVLGEGGPGSALQPPSQSWVRGALGPPCSLPPSPG